MLFLLIPPDPDPNSNRGTSKWCGELAAGWDPEAPWGVLSEATKYTYLSSTVYIDSFSKGIMEPSTAEWNSEVGAWPCFPHRWGVGSAGPCVFRTSGATYMRIQWSHQNQKFHSFQLMPPGPPTIGLAALRGRITFSLDVEDFTLEERNWAGWACSYLHPGCHEPQWHLLYHAVGGDVHNLSPVWWWGAGILNVSVITACNKGRKWSVASLLVVLCGSSFADIFSKKLKEWIPVLWKNKQTKPHT